MTYWHRLAPLAIAAAITAGCMTEDEAPAAAGASGLADSPICAEMWRAEFHTSIPATSREYPVEIDPRGERSQVNLVWRPQYYGNWELRVQGPAGLSPPSLVVAMPDCFHGELQGRAYELPVTYESPDDRTVVGVYTVDLLEPSFRIWIDVPAPAGRRVSVTARWVSDRSCASAFNCITGQTCENGICTGEPDPCPLQGCSGCTALAGCGYCSAAEGDGAIGCVSGDADGPTATRCNSWAWIPSQCTD